MNILANQMLNVYRGAYHNSYCAAAGPAGLTGPARRSRRTHSSQTSTRARRVSGWPKRCKLAHAFLWEYIDERLKLAQLLGQLGVFLPQAPPKCRGVRLRRPRSGLRPAAAPRAHKRDDAKDPRKMAAPNTLWRHHRSAAAVQDSSSAQVEGQCARRVYDRQA